MDEIRELGDPFDRMSGVISRSDYSLKGVRNESPDQSALIVNFNIGTLPLAQANAKEFFILMKKNLRISPDDNLIGFLIQNKIDIEEITMGQLDNQIPFQMYFKSGIVSYEGSGQREYVGIPRVGVGNGALLASAFGTSDHAELALGKTYECVCEAAGIKREWASAKTSVVAKGYSTATVERLNFSVDSVLSKKFANIFKERLAEEDKFRNNLGVLPVDQESGMFLKREYKVIPRMSELTFELVRIDMQSGSTDTAYISIRPRNPYDVGFGDYIVESKYQYEIHIELVEALKQVLNNEG